jgi:hypothetical protein
MNHQQIKKGVFIIILVGLFLPMLQKELKWIDLEPLQGIHDVTLAPDSFLVNWLSGKSQETYSKYFNDNLGYRPLLVRGYNQYRFSFYNKVVGEAGVIGNDNILYSKRYLTCASGEDFLGKDIIAKKVSDIKFVKEKMEGEGKRLLIVLAPNKARYFSNEVPKRFQAHDSTNYSSFIQEFEKGGIDYIDFNQSFIQKKAEIDYHLIPKYGIHWSVYGAQIASDSIISYCNNRYNFNLPTMLIDSIEESKTPRYSDYDLGMNLNLLSKFDDEIYAYPHVRVVKNKLSKRKKLLVVSDSFFGAMYRTDFSKKVFDMTGWWYYNKKIKSKGGLEKNRAPEDINEALPKTDLVIILVTEWNLYRLGFGFIEELKSKYNGGKGLSQYDLNVIYYLERIRKDKGWMKGLEVKAKKLNISIDSCLAKSAKKWALKKSKDEGVYNVNAKKELNNQIRIIKNNDKWLESVKEKALKKGVSVDSMLCRTAKYVLNKKAK